MTQENIPGREKKAAPSENKTESKPAAPKKKRSGRRAFSISGTLSGAEEKEEAQDNEPVDPLAPEAGKAKDQYSEEQLQNFYSEFIGLIKKRNTPRVLATLQHKQPRIIQPEQLELSMDNALQVEYFEEIKVELTRYLREKLNNHHLRIVTKIEEQSETKLPYSAEERYQYLLKKNPALAELRKRLNLDIE